MRGGWAALAVVASLVVLTFAVYGAAAGMVVVLAATAPVWWGAARSPGGHR